MDGGAVSYNNSSGLHDDVSLINRKNIYFCSGSFVFECGHTCLQNSAFLDEEKYLSKMPENEHSCFVNS